MMIIGIAILVVLATIDVVSFIKKHRNDAKYVDC